MDPWAVKFPYSMLAATTSCFDLGYCVFALVLRHIICTHAFSEPKDRGALVRNETAS